MMNGLAVDPFPYGDEVSIWRNGATPLAADVDPESQNDVPSTDWDVDALQAVAGSCKERKLRRHLLDITDADQLGVELSYWMLFEYWLFDHQPLVASEHVRRPRLDLPFTKSEVTGFYIARD